MVGADLSNTAAAGGAVPVVLSGGDAVSGLAEMLQQFVEQTLADSPRKVRQARRLAGDVVFRSAEDDELSVRISFTGDRIQLHDGSMPGAGDATITADFLTIAHLTSGQESPFRLLAGRKLKARFSLLQVPFLWRMLRFMQIDAAPRSGVRVGWLWLPAAAVGGAAVYWYLAAQF